MASSNRPSFISAIPSACQPSKKFESICTHWRYFSTALSRSPTATSPLASSKISSGVAIHHFRTTTITVTRKCPTAPLILNTSCPWWTLCEHLAFLEFQAGCLLPVAQPFHKNNALFVLKHLLLKRCLFLAGNRLAERLSLFSNCYASVSARRHKIGNIAGIQQCDRVLNREKLRRLFFRFFVVGLF